MIIFFNNNRRKLGGELEGVLERCQKVFRIPTRKQIEEEDKLNPILEIIKDIRTRR